METTLLTGVRNQKAVIEYRDEHGPEWWVMLDSGQVESFDTASAALAAVRKMAKKGNRTVTITTIEWRDVPSGFKPPKS